MGAWRALVMVGLLAVGLVPAVPAAAIQPVYSRRMGDCVTGQNQTRRSDGKFGWFVSAGCDSYQNERYERPTSQSFESMNVRGGGQIWGAKEYYENLDIRGAEAGFDDRLLYVKIQMNGLDHVTEDGTQNFQSLFYKYFVTISTTGDGANGWLLWADQPSLANGGKESRPNTVFTSLKTFGNRDTNGDVGGSGTANGINITKSDNASAARGDGFDLARISDGRLQGGSNPTALWARINPANHTEVEFAVNYGLLGFTRQQVADIINGVAGYFDLRSAKGGPKDPQNFMWNDEYTRGEAGSPYRFESPNGTQNIYEVDTLQWGSQQIDIVPEPSSWTMLIIGFGLVGLMVRRRRALA